MSSSSPQAVIRPPHEKASERWTTSREACSLPVHRWYLFPHSYHPALVDWILDEWRLKEGELLDPFVGSGTTLLAAQDRGMSGLGVDISPFAVFVSRVKLRRFGRDLGSDWELLSGRLDAARVRRHRCRQTDRLLHFFPPAVLESLFEVRCVINELVRAKNRPFFVLALLRSFEKLSHFRRDGGWPKRKTLTAVGRRDVLSEFETRVGEMLQDVSRREQRLPRPRVRIGDARRVQRTGRQFQALITSPPYPNKHDYTRIFEPELLFEFMAASEVRSLRHRTLNSHVEARPRRPRTTDMLSPVAHELVHELEERARDSRVPRMIGAYLQDLHRSLAAASKVLVPSAPMAWIVGNVRYYGLTVPIDELFAEIATRAGFGSVETRVLRYRGNSAQQMGRHGRVPSRESLVTMYNH